jgi:hypothetical protein
LLSGPQNKSLFAHINAKHVKQQREVDSGREVLDSVVARQKQPEFETPHDEDDVVELVGATGDITGDELQRQTESKRQRQGNVDTGPQLQYV